MIAYVTHSEGNLFTYATSLGRNMIHQLITVK